MTKKAKLALDLLERELELITKKDQSNFIGGYNSSNGYWSDVNGEYVYTYNGGSLDEIIINAPTNSYGVPQIVIEKDGAGRTYYRDNTGRVHYVMDSGLLWEGIKNIFTSFSSYAGAGYDAFRQTLGLTTLGGLAISVIDPVFDEWWNMYVTGDGGYAGVGSDGLGH